jgi:hypothetical protein
MRKKAGLVCFAAGILLVAIPILAQAPSTVTGFSVILGAPATGPAPCSDAAAAGSARYLRQGATGANNGTDWTNAWTSLATAEANAARGQTICVAGGTYNGVTFDKPNSGTTRISFVKALVGDHGTSTGWSNTFGSTQATITGCLLFSTGYWTFNGQVGDYYASGIGSYGFRVDFGEGSACAAGGASGAGMRIMGDNVIVQYMDCDGIAATGEHTYTSQAKCVEAYGGNNWTFSHGAMHGCESCLQGGQSNFVLEYTYIYNSRSNAANFHNNVFYISGANGGDIRYNHIFDFSAEGLFMTGFDGPVNNIRIYGNTIQNFGGEGNFPRCVELRQDYSYSGILVYNNTCVNVGTGIINRAPETGNTCSGCIVRNNISVSSGNTLTGTTNDNNTDDSNTSRFVNLGTRTSAHNLRLTAALAGVSLTSAFGLDSLGNNRGVDGAWDRGAYEFCAGGCQIP